MSTEEYIKPVLPKTGHLMIEDVKDLVMCKPHIIPLKSFTLEKLEKMQKEAQKLKSEQNEQSEEN